MKTANGIAILLILTIASFILQSCDKDTVYKEFSRFEDNRWYKNDVKKYDAAIDVEGQYDLYIDYSYVFGSPTIPLPVEVAITSPDGTEMKQEVMIKFLDENGSSVSDCSGDICDLKQIALTNVTLKKGTYKIKLANAFNHEFLPNTIGAGICIKKSKAN